MQITALVFWGLRIKPVMTGRKKYFYFFFKNIWIIKKIVLPLHRFFVVNFYRFYYANLSY
jgi:hypothetical protein